MKFWIVDTEIFEVFKDSKEFAEKAKINGRFLKTYVKILLFFDLVKLSLQ